MASVQLQTLDQQGSSSAASTSISPSIERRPTFTRATETSLPRTSAASPGPLLEQQQQQQQQSSQEGRQLQTELALEEARRVIQQWFTQATSEETHGAPQQLQTEAQQGQQEIENGTHDTPPSLWSKIAERLGFIVAVLAFLLAIGMIAPTVGQYATGVWSAAKDYQDWCKGEQSMEHTLTDACALIIDRPLPPPPGLNQVFKGVRRREVGSVDASPWSHLTDMELKGLYSTALFGFSMLAIALKGKDIELIVCSVSMGYLIEEAWATLPLRSIFLIIYFIWEPWFAYDLGYVFLLADHTYFLGKVGDDEGTPWVGLAVVLNSCRIAYTTFKSQNVIAAATRIMASNILQDDRTYALFLNLAYIVTMNESYNFNIALLQPSQSTISNRELRQPQKRLEAHIL
ncbi:hypothetical protein V501_01750 [Pseudogymnoascus sp. VKM F-4519 (FW-2642)]|nr:hypothetical protein V501_01750 [Pseudogymnoascus sp. VKM F-4519 (FW-2642)]